jgi:hypothetical protein
MLLIEKIPEKHNHRDYGPRPLERLPMSASMATAPPERELALLKEKLQNKASYVAAHKAKSKHNEVFLQTK